MKKKTVLYHIQQMAEKYPDKLCIFEKKGHVSYGQYWKLIQQYAAYFRERGVKEGTRVALVAEQTIRFLTSVSALHLLGAVAVPLEKNLPEKRILEIMDRLETIWLIHTERKKNFGLNVICLDQVSEYVIGEKIDEWELPKEDSLADILFTTGTTGTPKGIEITHSANQAIAENVIDSVDLQWDDIELIPTPINHSLGLRRYYGAMYRGSGIGILDGVIYIEDVYEMLKKYKVTAITLVPAMLSILLQFSREKLKDFDGQLRFIQLGSSPISKREREELCSLLPHVRLYNTYGATEAGCSCIFDFSKEREKVSCIGRPTVNTKISFADDAGKEIETSKDSIGYLVLEGPMNMRGYWREPEITKEVLRDGKIYTNDIGYQGEDGAVYLVGRKDDVINSGGNKIAPSEIEETVLDCEEIQECACIPVRDKVAGQVPKLFVVMKKEKNFNPQRILAYLAERLEPFKVPKYVEELERIPRSYNGKVLRKELREREEEKYG